MLAGHDCIDDLDVLRCAAIGTVLGAIGSWHPRPWGRSCAFTSGHTRRLDRLTETALALARAAGAGPGDGPMTIDEDSTIIGVHGYHKQGASYGYNHTLGYHCLPPAPAPARPSITARGCTKTA
jgi:hypothetical protein